MAITEVKLIAETVSEQDTSGYSYTEVYQVIADAVLTAAAARVATDGSTTIPAFRAASGSDSNALALRINSRRKAEGSDLVWLVTVDYRTPTRRTFAADPTDDPVLIDWTSWAWSQVIAKEQDGTVITNSAGQPLRSILQDAHDMQVVIVRNQNSYNPVLAWSYHDTVNSDSTTIAGLPVTARQAKLLTIGFILTASCSSRARGTAKNLISAQDREALLRKNLSCKKICLEHRLSV
jgi:hypothetical protein